MLSTVLGSHFLGPLTLCRGGILVSAPWGSAPWGVHEDPSDES